MYMYRYSHILRTPLILDNFLDSPLGLEDHCVWRWRCNHLKSQFHTHTKFSYHQQHQGLSTSVTCVMSVMSPRWSIVFILPIFNRVEKAYCSSQGHHHSNIKLKIIMESWGINLAAFWSFRLLTRLIVSRENQKSCHQLQWSWLICGKLMYFFKWNCSLSNCLIC